jgi:hypothetical protein
VYNLAKFDELFVKIQNILREEKGIPHISKLKKIHLKIYMKTGQELFLVVCFHEMYVCKWDPSIYR